MSYASSVPGALPAFPCWSHGLGLFGSRAAAAQQTFPAYDESGQGEVVGRAPNQYQAPRRSHSQIWSRRVKGYAAAGSGRCFEEVESTRARARATQVQVQIFRPISSTIRKAFQALFQEPRRRKLTGCARTVLLAVFGALIPNLQNRTRNFLALQIAARRATEENRHRLVARRDYIEAVRPVQHGAAHLPRRDLGLHALQEQQAGWETFTVAEDVKAAARR